MVLNRNRVIFVTLLILLAGVIISFKNRLTTNHLEREKESKDDCNLLEGIQQPFCITNTLQLDQERSLVSVYHPFKSISAIAIVENNNYFIQWLGQENPHLRDGYFPTPGEYVKFFGFQELDGSAKTREFVVQFTNTGTARVHPWYVYAYDEGRFSLLLQLIESDNIITISDLDNNGVKEIIHNYSIYGIGSLERKALRWTDIWNIREGKAQKVNAMFPNQYQELFEYYSQVIANSPEDLIDSYKAVIDCLRDNTLSVIQGEEVLIDECENVE